MRIEVLRAGNIADALGTAWVRAGHRALFGGRSPDRARALAARAGGRAGTPAQAAGFGDALMLAVPHPAMPGVLTALDAASGALRDRVLIDCVNAAGPGFVLTTGSGPGAARALVDATGPRRSGHDPRTLLPPFDAVTA